MAANDETLDPFLAVLKVLKGTGKYITEDIDRFTKLRGEVSDSYQPYVTCPGKNYSKLEFQCAYIFIYFPIHSLLEQNVFEFAKQNDPDTFKHFFMNNLFSQNAINVCSIGGGPGTDFFGLALLAEKESRKGSKFPKLKGTILEYHCNWQAMFGAFRQACPLLLKYIDDVSYVNYDFKKPDKEDFELPIKYFYSKLRLENAFRDDNPDKDFRGYTKTSAKLYISIWEKDVPSAEEKAEEEEKQCEETDESSDESQPMEN